MKVPKNATSQDIDMGKLSKVTFISNIIEGKKEESVSERPVVPLVRFEKIDSSRFQSALTKSRSAH